MNSKCWKTILIERILSDLSGAIWVQHLLTRRLKEGQLKTHENSLIHYDTWYIATPTWKANMLTQSAFFLCQGGFMSLRRRSGWLWLITADLIWSLGNMRWNQMKQSDASHAMQCASAMLLDVALAYLGCCHGHPWGSPLQIWAPAATNPRNRQHLQLTRACETNYLHFNLNNLNNI